MRIRNEESPDDVEGGGINSLPAEDEELSSNMDSSHKSSIAPTVVRQFFLIVRPAGGLDFSVLLALFDRLENFILSGGFVVSFEAE